MTHTLLFNLLVVRYNASPVTTQIWCSSAADAAEQCLVLAKRYSAEDGHDVLAMFVHDTQTHATVELGHVRAGMSRAMKDAPKEENQ